MPDGSAVSIHGRILPLRGFNFPSTAAGTRLLRGCYAARGGVFFCLSERLCYQRKAAHQVPGVESPMYPCSPPPSWRTSGRICGGGNGLAQLCRRTRPGRGQTVRGNWAEQQFLRREHAVGRIIWDRRGGPDAQKIATDQRAEIVDVSRTERRQLYAVDALAKLPRNA